MSQNDPENASWLRPLPENFADEGHYKKRKLILVGLSAAVLIGFGLMIWFSYTSENEEGGPIPVVRADNAVIKENQMSRAEKKSLFKIKKCLTVLIIYQKKQKMYWHQAQKFH